MNLDLLYLKIRGKPTVKEVWDLLKSYFEKRSQMFIVDVRCQLQDERCDDKINIHTHFDTMCTMCEDFSTILLGSLPYSYNSLPLHCYHHSECPGYNTQPRCSYASTRARTLHFMLKWVQETMERWEGIEEEH